MYKVKEKLENRTEKAKWAEITARTKRSKYFYRGHSADKILAELNFRDSCRGRYVCTSALRANLCDAPAFYFSNGINPRDILQDSQDLKDWCIVHAVNVAKRDAAIFLMRIELYETRLNNPMGTYVFDYANDRDNIKITSKNWSMDYE